ncbi:T9SS type A sorting domain-containing protein, partial [Aureispira]|nr:T9SS type A sorting domain-containing protein [Aureispira sp.]MDC0231608.1 T9SS type A sorting domain-containing protein [Aureispira sp.]
TLPKALDKNASINVYNALGQTIFSSTLEEGKQFWSIDNINLSGTNVYFVDIEGYEKSAKIIWE